MPVEVRLEGTEALARTFKTYLARTEAGAKRAVATTAKLIESGAKERVPVDEGRLKGSIRDWYYRGGLTAEIGSDLGYAAAVENGTGPHEVPWGALYAWALRKSGDKRSAGALAAGAKRAIAAHGQRPHPYLKPAAEAELPGFLLDLQRRLREHT